MKENASAGGLPCHLMTQQYQRLPQLKLKKPRKLHNSTPVILNKCVLKIKF